MICAFLYANFNCLETHPNVNFATDQYDTVIESHENVFSR